MSGTRRILRKLAVSAVAFLVACLLAEGAHRLWLAHRGEPHDSWAAYREIRRRTDLARSFLDPVAGRDPDRGQEGTLGILHPYFGSEQQHDTGGVLAHFRAGVPKDEYTVLIVGGSVAAAFAVNAGDELSGMLQKDPRLAGRTVKTLNYAHPGFKEPQQLMRVAWLFSLGYRPDAVINLDGFNEVALALTNEDEGTHWAFPSFPQWGVLVQDYRAMGSDELEVLLEFWGVRQSAQRLHSLAVGIRAYHSSLLTWAVLARMDALNRERALLQAELVRRRARSKVSEPMLRQLRGPPLEVDRQHVLEHCVATWADGSRCLDALCKRMGTAYLDVLQPTLGDAGSKKRTEKEKAIPFPSDGWVRGSRDGFPMLRETGKTLAAEGIAFLDASRAFEDTEEELYYDACHFGPRGCEILCGLVAQAFLEKSLKP